MNFSEQIKAEICKIDDLSLEGKKSFLRAIFLTCGYGVATDSSYHLEISVNNINLAEIISNLLKTFDFPSKFTTKGKKYIFFIKNNENISNLLAAIGANSAMMNFENIKIIKEIRQNANRLTNCETGNVAKTITAAQAQIKKIEEIGINNLPEKFQEVAILRIENPECSLSEIAMMCNPIRTKSNVNYIINQILNL